MPLKNRTGSCKKCKKPGSSIAPSNNSIFQILDELQTSIPSMADIDEESEASITEVCFFYFIFWIEIHFHGKI